MSLRALIWAFDVLREKRVKRDSAKLVLLKLADRSNDDGTCWPGRERLGDDLGLSEPTVRQGTRELEGAGVIRIERRKDGAGRDLSNVYHLPIWGEGKDSYPRGKESNPGGQESYPGGLNAYPESINSNHPREAAARAAPPPPQQHAAAPVSKSDPTPNPSLRRRRGDELVRHGVEIWTEEDGEAVTQLAAVYGAARVQEVATSLTPAQGHRAPYRSAVAAALAALDAAAANEIRLAELREKQNVPALDPEIVRTKARAARAAIGMGVAP